MDIHYVNIFFQFVAFLFAVSFHEAAHAWTADRCGDDTARMLGRVSLNPIKHIDPVGTLILPLIGLFTGIGTFGWGKPCPVNPLRLRDKVRSDILVSVAGPLSNAILVMSCLILLVGIMATGVEGKAIVQNMAHGYITSTSSVLMPIVWLIYSSPLINVLLGIFNLIPIPPLDGSHVLTHLLPEPIKTYYSNFGMLGLIVLITMGGGLVRAVTVPVVGYLNGLLLKF